MGWNPRWDNVVSGSLGCLSGRVPGHPSGEAGCNQRTQEWALSWVLLCTTNRGTVGKLLSQQGPRKWQTEVRPLFLRWEKRRGCAPQESAGLGDWKQGRVPETEMFGHSLGEQGVRLETRGQE